MATIQQGLSNFETAQRSANEASSTAITLGDQLKSALNEKLANSPIVSERSQAASGFLTELGNAPTQVLPQNTGGTIFNPSEQASIISGRRAGALMPLLTANQRYDLLSGNISDIVGATSRAAQAEATSKQGEANIADKLLQNLFKKEELDISRQKAASGGGTSLSQLLSVFRLMQPTATQASDAINARSGLRALDQLQELMGSKPNIARSAATPILSTLNQSARQWNQAAKEAYDILTRTRTGAALNLNEQQFYKEFVPTAIDSAETAKIKLDRLRSLYTDIAAQGDEPSLSQFLSAGGQDIPGLSSGAGEWELVQ